MKRARTILCLTVLNVCIICGCGEKSKFDTSESVKPLAETLDETLAPETSMPVAGISDTEREEEKHIKVTDGTNEIVFKLNDSSASKSLYEQLPLTLDVENYSPN